VALRDREPLPGEGPFQPPPAQQPAPRQVPATPLSWGIIAVCVVKFLLDAFVPGMHQTGELVLGAVAAGQWWRVPLSIFTHWGILHLVFNMSVVWTLGRVLEVGIGRWRFFLASVIGALGSAFLTLWLAPLDAHTAGASGMILSWAGAMLPIATKAGRRQLGIWLVQVLVISLLPGVSWQGHLGGFLFGLAAGVVMRQGPAVFRSVSPALIALGLALTWLAGSGHLVRPW